MTDEHSERSSSSQDQAGRPAVLVFDVNETLSDMSPMGQRFEDLGAPAHLAASWFAGLLRDGFALTAVGASESFAHLAAESLRIGLHGQVLNRGTTMRSSTSWPASPA
jgi:2-haloacid dehalogenase